MILKTLVCFGLFNFGCLATSDIVNNDISTDENELSSIERPCRVFDMFCIRQYFAQHSGCKKTFGPTPSPMYKAQSTFYLPIINLTLTSLNVNYTLNGMVDEFYMAKRGHYYKWNEGSMKLALLALSKKEAGLNEASRIFGVPKATLKRRFDSKNVKAKGEKQIVGSEGDLTPDLEKNINKKTDNLLLAIEFKDLTFRSNDNYFRFHRKGKEPIVNKDFLNITYTSIVVTITIPNLKDLKLQDGEVFLYINDNRPPFVVGPRAFLSTDPQVEATFVKLLADVPTVIIEALFTDAAFFIGSFIQYNICDFGIEIL